MNNQNHPILIAITGGIGSGKSVISEMLRIMRYKVYDCDKRAAAITDSSTQIKDSIISLLGKEAFTFDGRLNRKYVASIVFSDREKLEALNSIIHCAVKADINRWVRQNADQPLLFVETAILYQSGLHKEVHKILNITAPEKVRIARVIKRSGLSETEIKKRIEAQNITIEEPHTCVHDIDNSGDKAVLPQLLGYLDNLDRGELL